MNMINESNISENVQESQREIALDRISSLALQQARRNVADDISNENVIDETFKKSADIFMQNLDKISKINITGEKTDIELEKMEESGKENSLVETRSEILKGEEFIKLKQRGSIITGRKASIFVSPSVPAVLGTASHEMRRKTLHLEESETFLEPLESPILRSKMKGSENIGVRSMHMEVPLIESKLTPLEVAAISCVLEECLEQLATVEFMIPAKVDPRWDETFKTIDEIYGVPDEPRIIFREDMGLLPLIPTTAEKLQRDRTYIYKVLERLLRDIKDNGRFDNLQEEINNIAKKQEGEHNLEANAEIWSNQATQLRELLASDKEKNEKDRKEKIKLAQESDAQIDHTIFSNSGKLDYTERWERARLEQQELRLKLQNAELLEKLSNYSKEYNIEQIISAELSTYLQADIKEKEEQVNIWTKKYNEEIVQIQQEIEELKKQIEDQSLEIENMRALKDERQKFINEYIAEQKRLQEEAELQKKLNQAATIIQSIWRSYMVRHQLGQHKNLRKRLKRRKMKKETTRKKQK